MADDNRTEQATPRKREKAREEGRVAISRDLTAGLAFGAAALVAQALWPRAGKEFARISQWTFTLAGARDLDAHCLTQMAQAWGTIWTGLVLPVVASSLVTGLVVGMGQTRMLFALKVLQPRLDRLSPVEGMKRLVSVQGLAEAAKSGLKILLVLGSAALLLWARRSDFARLSDCSLKAGTGLATNLVFSLLKRCAGALILIGIADYAFQWWQYERSLRMSRQELIDEYKQYEGDPNMRARRKSMRRNMLQQGISREMKQATAVVVNPTHLAVALWYEPGMIAPRVVAKGRLELARRIVQIAQRQGIPVVQNIQVARGLYKTTRLGDYVPGPLYQAVAEVLAGIYRRRQERLARQALYSQARSRP